MVIGQIQAYQAPNWLFKQWGLLGAMAGLFAVAVAMLIVVLQAKGRDVSRSTWSIQGFLVGMFKRVICDEARKVLGLIDFYLPAALAQEQDATPSRSGFDALCVALRDFDVDDPNRAEFAVLLRRSLADVMSKAGERLLDDSNEEPLAGSRGPQIGFTLSSGAELRLLFISEVMGKVKRQERVFYRAKKLALLVFAAHLATGIGSFPSLFIEDKWSLYYGVICVSISLIGLTAFLVLSAVLLVKKHELEKTLQQHPTSEAWEEEFAQAKLEAGF